jgi:hypothetical protein
MLTSPDATLAVRADVPEVPPLDDPPVVVGPAGWVTGGVEALLMT